MNKNHNDRWDYTGNQPENQNHEIINDDQKAKKKNHYKNKENQYNSKGREDKNSNEYINDIRNHNNNNKTKWTYKNQQNEQNQNTNILNKKNKRKQRDNANIVSNNNPAPNINQDKNLQQQNMEDMHSNEKEDKQQKINNLYVNNIPNQQQQNINIYFPSNINDDNDIRQNIYLHQFNNNNNNNNIHNMQPHFLYYNTNQNLSNINNINTQPNQNILFNPMLHKYNQFNRTFNGNICVNYNNQSQNQNINLGMQMNYYPYSHNNNANTNLLRKSQNDIVGNPQQHSKDENLNINDILQLENNDNFNITNNNNKIFQQQKKNNKMRNKGNFNIDKQSQVSDTESIYSQTSNAISQNSLISDRSEAPLPNQNFLNEMYINKLPSQFPQGNYGNIQDQIFLQNYPKNQLKHFNFQIGGNQFPNNQTIYHSHINQMKMLDKKERKNDNKKKNNSKNDENNIIEVQENNQSKNNNTKLRNFLSHNENNFNESDKEICDNGKDITTLLLKLKDEGKEQKEIRINIDDDINKIAQTIVEEYGLNIKYGPLIIRKIQQAIEISQNFNNMKISNQNDLKLLKQLIEKNEIQKKENSKNNVNNLSQNSLTNSIIHEMCSFERNLREIQSNDEFELMNTTI